ncbi:hypothetical protein ACFW04_013051 [Cataglyphis niger]
MFGPRVLVPNNLGKEGLETFHLDHQGIVKCECAKSSLWWPDILSDIKQKVEQFNRHGFFNFKDCWYFLIADYYCRYPELYKIQSMSTRIVIQCLFRLTQNSIIVDFKNKFDFELITSSPYYSKSNGFIEIMVKTIKLGLAKTGDACLFLMEYQSTPLECGFTPSELLMGRKIHSLLPIHPNILKPILIDREIIQREKARIECQKTNHDQKHYTTESIHLKIGDEVWMKDTRMWGIIKQICSEPRIRRGTRNRKHPNYFHSDSRFNSFSRGNNTNK